MPDKDGDDEKTTKGVVKKKTKQMLNQEYIPEEEYDRYRDNILMRGGDHRSKETKERSNTPTGKQPKGKTVYQKQAEKKYGKGKSALDMVKADITAKYGKGAIMDVKKKSKKKANVQDEFDLTKIAEAFGGYIVEAKSGNKKKSSNKNQNQEAPPIRSGVTDSDPSFEVSFRRSKEFKKLSPDQKAGRTYTTRKSVPSLTRGSGFGPSERINPDDEKTQQTQQKLANQRIETGKKQSTTAFTNEPLDDVNIPKEVRDPKTGETLTKDYADTEAETEKKRKEVKQSAYANPETARKGERVVDQDKYSTRTGIVGRGGVEVTTGKGDGRKAGRTPDERKTGKVTYKAFVNKPEVTGNVDAKDSGETVTYTTPDKRKKRSDAGKKRVKKDKVIVKEPETQIKKEPETQTAVGGDDGKKPPKVSTSTGATGGGKEPSLVSKVAKFSKENPATALLSLDALRRFMPSSSPFGVSGGRVGRRSAPS